MSLRTCALFGVARISCGVSSLFSDVLVWRRPCGLVKASVWISKVWAMWTGDLDCVVFVNVNTGHYGLVIWPCDDGRVALWKNPCGFQKYGTYDLETWIVWFLWIWKLVSMVLWYDRVTLALCMDYYIHGVDTWTLKGRQILNVVQ